MELSGHKQQIITNHFCEAYIFDSDRNPMFVQAIVQSSASLLIFLPFPENPSDFVCIKNGI